MKINKGLLGSLLSSLSGRDRKLLTIFALLASQRVQTRAERELAEYSRGKLERILGRSNMEKLFMSGKESTNDLFNALGKLNSLGVTRSQMIEKMSKFNKEKLNKMSPVDEKSPTNEPDSQEYAVYNCPKCGFTIDAVKELPLMNCIKCGTKMIGLTREEYHKKSGFKGFNEVDETGPVPRPPRVVP